MTPAWTVGAWPPVLWQPERESRPHFVHLGTHVSPRLSNDWPLMGQSVWGGRCADSAAGVSWDWIEIADGVVAIADPMMMISNLRVLGRDGEVLTAYEAAPHLNGIVNRLPWQEEVERAITALHGEDRPRQRLEQGLALRPPVERRASKRVSSGFMPFN